MGIRYYAYAFDNHQTEAALADPGAFISSDPLADAWGFEPHARVAVMSGVQALPERDMLYLDKAWRELQQMTKPRSAIAAPRPAYRMFEGDVTMHGLGWQPWIRALAPVEIGGIVADLASLRDQITAGGHADGDDDAAYVQWYLGRACTFMTDLAADRRGMVYTIG